jgi:hypothetical protein
MGKRGGRCREACPFIVGEGGERRRHALGARLYSALQRSDGRHVTPGFKAKTRCSSYVCPGSSCHTYDHNLNTENQCLKYINFIT